MPRVHTHYANLKVARDAPIEVIKAAYKSLSLKYHPDQHHGSEKAARIMRIINTSYEVLSDPVRRLQHDQWIASHETDSPPTTPPPEEKSNTGTETQSKPPAPEFIQVTSGWFQRDGWQSWLAGVIMFIVFIAGLIPWDKSATTTTQNQPAAPSAVTTESPEASADTSKLPSFREFLDHDYVRPALAPSGNPWPTTSGYLNGFDQGDVDRSSLSSLTIDNIKGGSDVFVKIREADAPFPPVRVFFLRAGDQFTVENISAGAYTIRYLDLDSGIISKSEILFFYRTNRDGEVFYPTKTVTLYGVLNPERKIHFETIGPDQF